MRASRPVAAPSRRALAGVILGAALAASCGGAATEYPRGPLVGMAAGPIGRPILGFAWKKVIVDRSEDSLPQEFAGPVVAPAAAGVDDGVVFVGSHAGVFYALRARDGAELWRQKIGSTSAVPLYLGGRLYVGTDEGAMVALDADTGAVRWRHGARGAIVREPVVVNDLLVFATDTDRLVALDRDTGKWRWEYGRDTPEEFTIRGHAGPAVSGDRVFAGFADGHLVSLNVADGEVAWVRSLAGGEKQFIDVDTTPVVHAGVVYAASIAGGLYAVNADDGTERWRVDAPGTSQLALDEARLYAAAADSGLHALDLQGHVLWRQGFSRAGDPARPVLDDLLVLAVSERGVYLIDERSGELLRSFDPGPGVSAPPAILGNRMFLLSNGGLLYAMHLRR